MGLRGKSKKQRLEEFLLEKQPAAIAEEQWRALTALLAPISESYLRELLHATGLEIAQPFCGARLSSFEELGASLIAMEKEYAKAVAAGDRARATACRHAVIQAKDRARLISRNQKVDPLKRRQKEEMVEWLLVWLENPGVFSTWVALKRRALDSIPTPG